VKTGIRNQESGIRGSRESALALLLTLCLSTVPGAQSSDLATLERATELAPTLPRAWYALGQAYNAIKQDAMRSFNAADDVSWQQLLVADGLLAAGKFTDAFTLYRTTLDRLPSMVSIHDSVARIYEHTGHADWATRERSAGTLPAADCAKRTALCAFRAGRYRAALAAVVIETDPESRYWRARAANELALAAFAHLESLADSPERRSIRATVARAEDRHTDAIAELTAALTFVPGNPALVFDLASSCYQARDYERAIATLQPLLQARPDDPRLLTLVGYSLLQLRRPEEALPLLQRVVERDAGDPGARLALGRAYLQTGAFAAAIPLIEPELGSDQDGSLHVQLARAYTALGQKEKGAALLARSQEMQRAADERTRAMAQQTITPPK